MVDLGVERMRLTGLVGEEMVDLVGLEMVDLVGVDRVKQDLVRVHRGEMMALWGYGWMGESEVCRMTQSSGSGY